MKQKSFKVGFPVKQSLQKASVLFVFFLMLFTGLRWLMQRAFALVSHSPAYPPSVPYLIIPFDTDKGHRLDRSYMCTSFLQIFPYHSLRFLCHTDRFPVRLSNGRKNDLRLTSYRLHFIHRSKISAVILQ